MARKIVTITTLIDDLDGTPLDEGEGQTVRFALDGTEYEIDLSRSNAEAMRDALKPYIGAARKAGRGTALPVRAPRSGKEDLAAARAWLRANGHPVSDRGRIPNALMELYRARG